MRQLLPVNRHGVEVELRAHEDICLSYELMSLVNSGDDVITRRFACIEIRAHSLSPQNTSMNTVYLESCIEMTSTTK